MSTKSEKQIQFKWEDLVPTNWLDDPAKGSIWVSGFMAMGLSKEHFVNGPKLLDFGNIRAIVLLGQVGYVELTELEIRGFPMPQFHYQVDEKLSPEGAYLLIIQPFDQENNSGLEPMLRANTQILAGFLATFFGQNLVYRRLFDNIVNIHDNKKTVSSPSFRNPTTLPIPELGNLRTERALNGYRSLSNLPANEVNRINLSLQWFYEGINSRGVDTFLKCWFAIEALGMSDKENIKPITESLSRAYGISYQEAKQRFRVGKLFEFRSRIVHKGEIYPIHSFLSDYVESLYADILCDRLGIECDRKAEATMNRDGFDLNNFIY